jgi:hypothetical protein
MPDDAVKRPEDEPRTLIFVDMLGFAELTSRIGTRNRTPTGTSRSSAASGRWKLPASLSKTSTGSSTRKRTRPIDRMRAVMDRGTTLEEAERNEAEQINELLAIADAPAGD